MANTRETMGEAACLDALVADTLTSFEDDGVTKVGKQALWYHKSLTELKMSSCASIGESGASYCDALELVDIRGGGSIGNYALRNDPKLKHVLLRGSAVGTLAATNAFDGTPLAYGEGAVYVPSDLVDDYRSATNWSGLVIKPIGEYPATDFSAITDSWDDIIKACGDGSYTKYEVGGTKSIDIDGTTYYMQLVGKDVDVLASDGTTAVPTTWLMYRKFYKTTHRMNPANSSGAQGTGANGGWEFSEMRTWLNDEVLPLLPSNVRSAIKEVRKYSGNIVPGESTVTKDGCVTADKLWIPSEHELNISTTYETQGPTYSTSVYPNASSYRIKYNQSGSASYWWLRSALSATYFRNVSGGGNADTSNANNSRGVVLGFSI